MRRIMIITLALALGALAFAQRAGDAVPEFTLVDAHGEVVRPQEYLGAPLLINFWATWCGPCKEELPLFQEAYEETDQLQMLLINLGEDRDVAQNYLDEQQVTLRTAVDPYAGVGADAEETGAVARRYRVLGLPTTVFVDADGVIRDVRIGQVLPNQLADGLAKIDVVWRP
ncbi:MAG: TlpA disulfide reductase family protein [Trueperaceae bacterium]|nr:TlpA disulfide reductase family protein [Trueperaceae bacterium]